MYILFVLLEQDTRFKSMTIFSIEMDPYMQFHSNKDL